MRISLAGWLGSCCCRGDNSETSPPTLALSSPSLALSGGREGGKEGEGKREEGREGRREGRREGEVGRPDAWKLACVCRIVLK